MYSFFQHLAFVTTISLVPLWTVSAGTTIYSENFSREGLFNENGTTDTGFYKGWSTAGIPNSDNKGYALARILSDGGRRCLSVQDFRWAGNPPGAEATTPQFSAGHYWRLEFVFQWRPHPTQNHQDKIEATVTLLNAAGEALVHLPFRSSGLTPMTVTGPGNVPLTPGDWYRATLLKANLNDDRFDLAIECVEQGKGEAHSLAPGVRKDLPAQATLRPGNGGDTFAAIRFSAVSGYGNMGTFNVAELKVSGADPSAKPRKDVGSRTLSTLSYTAVFQPSGSVDLYARFKRDKAGKQETPGIFAGGISGYRLGEWSSDGHVPEIVVREGRSEVESERDEAIDFSEIATSVTGKRIQWPEVELRFLPRKGETKPVVIRWTLAPDVARMELEVSPDNEPGAGDEGGASFQFVRSGGAQFVEEIKPARWLRNPAGGVPGQETKGMAQVFQSGSVVWAIANDYGFRKLIEDDDRVNFQVRKIRVPWMRSRLRGSAAFAFGADSSVVASQAVAVAAHDWLAFNLKSESPFYIYDEVRPVVLRGAVSNLFHAPQRADVSWRAVDYDGVVVSEGNEAHWLAPFEVWQPELRITPRAAGPLYLDAVARTNRGTEFQRVSLGVMPRREFTDGKESRFGISAYRGRVGTNGHTELRTEDQLLDLMHRAGIRWLRQTDGWELARKKGFHLWYHNNVPYNQATDDYFQGKKSWLSDETARLGFIDSNVKNTGQRGAAVLEFTNEWNLHGGEKKAVRAEKYAKDWLPLLRKSRDKLAPDILLGGGVVANGDIPFLKKVFDLGAWNDFDLLVFHASGVPRSPDTDEDVYWSYLQTLKDIRKALRMFGEKELWMSEFYAPSAPNSSVSNNERIAAEDLVLMVGLAIAADVRGMMYYCLDDFDRQDRIATAGEIGEPILRENYFGLLRRDWTPKAGLWAYANCAWLFEGARFLGDARLPGKTEGLVFEGKRGRFALVWDRSEGYVRHERSVDRNFHREPWEKFWTLEADLRLPVKDRATGLTVVDTVGRPTTVSPAADGAATIKVSGEPVFVFGVEWQIERGKYSRLFYPEKGEPER
ncbi:hypothetical protein OPIT5_16365 [Opitutaceae bacterium TAV5]|nr:hypothetical protein OPIT5_16365 [Opitutaceae bacterium TAV5]